MKNRRKMQMTVMYNDDTLAGLASALHVGTATPDLLREYLRSVLFTHCQKLTSVGAKEASRGKNDEQ